MSIVSLDAPRPDVAVSPDEALQAVMARLEQARQRIVRDRLAKGVLISAATMGLAAILAAIADFTWELPTAVRAVWLTVLAAGGLAAFFIGCKQVTSYSIDRAAADVERRIAAFGQRLRTNHDYQNQSSAVAPASPSLVDALRGDTYGVGRRVDWDDAVDRRPLFAAVAAAGVVGIIWAISLARSPEFRTAAGRVLLLPWEYTTVTYDPQASTVRPGDSVEINVAVAGRPIPSARLRFRPASGEGDWETRELDPLDGAVTDSSAGLHGRLGTTLAELEQDVEFEVLAGPRRLPTGSIRVLRPLTLDERQARVIPPAYTGLEEQTLLSFEMKVPEGSTVELQLVLNRPALDARLLLADSKVGQGDAGPVAGAGPALPREIPLVIESNTLRGQLADLHNSVSGTITARAADEMSLDPEPLEIRVQVDRKPEVQFIEPPEELVVTPITEVPILVEAKDDIGLYKMGILYQIGDGPMQTLWEEDAAGSVDPRQMAALLMLEQFSLSYRDGVTYHAFAEDNYFGQSRRTTTPLRFIDIRPFKQVYQLLESGGT